RAAVDADLPEAERGDQPDLLGPQHRAGLDHDPAGLDVLAAQAHVDALGAASDAHARADALDDLLRIDGVSAGGEGRAGHYPQRLSRTQRPGEHRAGGEVTDHVEVARAGARDV